MLLNNEIEKRGEQNRSVPSSPPSRTPITGPSEKNGLFRGAGYLQDLAFAHACFKHELFQRLNNSAKDPISAKQAVALLVNYDAHAGVLRRLLLKAAAHMPEAAVGYILENVRNEYGNGDYSQCHQGQLRDVIERVKKIGNLNEGSDEIIVSKGVKKYIRKIVDYYHPHGEHACINSGIESGGLSEKDGFRESSESRGPSERNGSRMYGPAITAGAITATELMALEEFKAMQVAFTKFELEYHPWFDHVNVECDHGEESLALAEYFIDNHNATAAVEYGFVKTLEANVDLYDGLLEAIVANEEN